MKTKIKTKASRFEALWRWNRAEMLKSEHLFVPDTARKLKDGYARGHHPTRKTAKAEGQAQYVLAIRGTRDELDWLRHAARLRRIPVAEYVKQAEPARPHVERCCCELHGMLNCPVHGHIACAFLEGRGFR